VKQVLHGVSKVHIPHNFLPFSPGNPKHLDWQLEAALNNSPEQLSWIKKNVI